MNLFLCIRIAAIITTMPVDTTAPGGVGRVGAQLALIVIESGGVASLRSDLRDDAESDTTVQLSD